MDELMKQRLMVFGLMQTLEAQLKSHKDHNQKLKENENEYKHETTKECSRLQFEQTNFTKQRYELETALEVLLRQLRQAEKEHFNNKMFIDGDHDTEKTKIERHDLLMKLLDLLNEKKKAELEKLNDEIEKLKQSYNSWKEYMDAIAEKDRMQGEIDDMNVKHGWYVIKVDIRDRA